MVLLHSNNHGKRRARERANISARQRVIVASLRRAHIGADYRRERRPYATHNNTRERTAIATAARIQSVLATFISGHRPFRKFRLAARFKSWPSKRRVSARRLTAVSCLRCHPEQSPGCFCFPPVFRGAARGSRDLLWPRGWYGQEQMLLSFRKCKTTRSRSKQRSR
jgi:hypothetical protein